jgi:hypothetical protein
MEKRDVDQEELAAKWCATAIPLYPATTSSRLETVGKCSMLMEKVSAGQCSFLCYYHAIYAWVMENT